MEENYLKSIVYSPTVVEFVTVVVRFCAFMENPETEDKHEFASTVIKLLPLMYIKAILLPEVVTVQDEEIETFVTEDAYALITDQIASVMQDRDIYLEVFIQDMKYSETPISAFVSEDLADIYQDVKNFACVYETGMTENMNDALCVCKEHFKTYWGQKLVNVMRALHAVSFDLTENEDIPTNPENEEELW